jgi:hypothetical protein
MAPQGWLTRCPTKVRANETKIVMGLIASSALAANGRYAAAAEHLRKVMIVYQRTKNRYVADCLYDGTLPHLQRISMRDPPTSAFIGLIGTVNTCKRDIRKQLNLTHPPCDAVGAK